MQNSLIFNCYSIRLRRLEQTDLHLVWQWRNCPFIREKMQYQEEISWQDHQRWFNGLHPKNDWYFIGFSGDSPLGIFHIKAIDWSIKTGEAGAFVASPHWLGKPEVGIAILSLMDFAFLYLKVDSLEAKYHPDFKGIANLNKQLGYEIFMTYDDGFVRAGVSRERYLEVAAKLRQTARSLKGGEVSLINPAPWFNETPSLVS